MHLVTYSHAGLAGVGVFEPTARQIIDVSQMPSVPIVDMRSFIAAGAPALEAARALLASGAARLAVEDVRLLAPIERPARNVICIGKNYREHARECDTAGSTAGGGVPSEPIFFTKAPSSVIGPDSPIPGWLDPTASVDYEGELAVIIGPGGRGISRADAMKHVYGYTIVNDVTSRRLQRLHQQWFLGKSIDGFCPMGPAIVTADEIHDVTSLSVRTYVNDELRQDGVVADLIFDIPMLIETLSRTMTLEPGDIIATGTPAGVGMGFDPPRFLQAGDRVSIAIEPIGTLSNPVA